MAVAHGAVKSQFMHPIPCSDHTPMPLKQQTPHTVWFTSHLSIARCHVSVLCCAELKARRVAVAQAMQEKKAAKAAAKKEQLEKAKVARAASMAAKAVARAAEAEAAAAASACAHLSSDDDFLGPLQGRAQQPCQATEQSRHSSHNAAGPSRSLNGAAQHAQHAQHGQAGSVPEGVRQPASRNGYLSYQSQHAQHSQRISHDSQAVLAESGAQDSTAIFKFPVESEHRGTPHLFHDQPMKEEDAWDGAHVQYMHSRGARQLPSELLASGSESRQPESEEADREGDRGGNEEFDWGAWMSPEGKRKAIAERLQRPRRPPKRPYPLLDPPKPKPKKPQQSLRGSSSQHCDARLQHRPPDRLQGSVATTSGQFSQEEWSHALGPMQQPHRHRPGSAPPGRTAAASQGATKGRSKGRSIGRRALEEVGCIRAAAYQGEAFMQARMDVLHQQGVLPGNQAPADAHPDHQVCHTTAIPPPYHRHTTAVPPPYHCGTHTTAKPPHITAIPLPTNISSPEPPCFASLFFFPVSLLLPQPTPPFDLAQQSMAKFGVWLSF